MHGDGGALTIEQSSITFAAHSLSIFANNSARGNGGAIYLRDSFTAMFSKKSYVNFSNNTAIGSGGSMYYELFYGLEKIILNTTGINFYNKTGLKGELIYVNVLSPCDDMCVKSSIVNTLTSLVYQQFDNYLITSSSELELYDPAICIDNVTNCGIYYVNNIMLGQEIITDSCVRDYYGHPAVATHFLININNEEFYINGLPDVLISCETLKGISVIGENVVQPLNISMTLTSHDGSQSDLRTISIALITELSPCHPGFYYNKTTCIYMMTII